MKNPKLRTLKTIFEATLKTQANNLVMTKVVVEAFRRRGIQLTKNQKEKLFHEITLGKMDKPSLRLSRKQQKLLGDAPLDVSCIDTDSLSRINDETWASLGTDLPSVIPKITDSVSQLFIRDIRKRMKHELKVRRLNQLGFEKAHYLYWKRALDLLQTLVFIALESGESFVSKQRGKLKHTTHVLIRIHARACQVAQEIVTLLRSGFADGAHARWRTLHELVVTAFFIADNGEPLAERFLAHHTVETFKAAEQYQKYCVRLGYKPLSKRELSKINKDKDKAITKYGKSFGTDYGWAASVIPTGRPTFRDIEERVQLDHIRPYYKLACQNVHAGVKSMFERLGLYEQTDNIILAGPSSIGLADPGHATAISLTQVTTALLLQKPSIDRFVALKVLDRLHRQIGEAFLKLQVD